MKAIPMHDARQVAVVGCGLAGTVLAMFLARAGRSVFICDKNTDPRLRKPSRGRSINLTLTRRGFSALEDLDIGYEVKQKSLPLVKRVIHSAGQIHESNYSSNSVESCALFSINRHTLHCLLLDILEQRFGVEPQFDLFCEADNIQEGTLTFTDNADEISSGTFSTVFAADGVFSGLRAALLSMLSTTNNQDLPSQLERSESFHANIELTIPRDAGFRGARDALHVWPAGDCTLIGFPSWDGSVVCTLQLPRHGKHSLSRLNTKGAIESFVKATFPDVEPFLDDYVTTLLSVNAMPMLGVKCASWTYKGKLCLIGDSAHAVFPSLGQGANCAFEDALIMNKLLAESSYDFDSAFGNFERLRKPDTDALHDMSVAQYELLRSPVQLAQDAIWRKIRAALRDKCEGIGDDYYESIAFSHERYAYVLEMDRLLRKIVGDAFSEQQKETVNEFEEHLVQRVNLAVSELRDKYSTV